MGKRNLTWTDEMDDLLIDSLIDQMRKGQKKVRGMFSKGALAIVADLISEQFDLLSHSEHVKNKMKTLKANFFVAKDILNSRQFSLNHSTQVIKAHPKASKLRYKPVRNYEKMDLLVGKDQATGSSTLVVGPKESQLPRATKELYMDANVTPLEYIEYGVDNHDVEEEELETSFAPDPLSKPKKNIVGKKAKVNHNVTAVLRYRRPELEPEAAVSNKSSILKLEVEQLIAKEIEKVGSMSLESQVMVYRTLTKDEKVARVFLAITGQRRRIWLRIEFRTDIFDE